VSLARVDDAPDHDRESHPTQSVAGQSGTNEWR